MDYPPMKSIVTGWLIALVAPIQAAPAGQRDSKPDMKNVGSILADWPPMLQLGVRLTITKHGAPQGVPPDAMIRTDVAPFKPVMVTQHEDHHDFPLPHMGEDNAGMRPACTAKLRFEPDRSL